MIKTADSVRDIVRRWLKETLPNLALDIGLPEVDDRYDVWRVSLMIGGEAVGELQVDMEGRTKTYTSPRIIAERASRASSPENIRGTRKNGLFYPAPVPNKIILGDAARVLEEFPPDTAQLVITSPPYFNAKPEYSEFIDYQEYLDFLRKIFVRVHAVLSDGRFFVINVSPVLVRRTSRSVASRRIPIPFDVHRIMDSVGFVFVDDIIWVKPEGAGWNTGRGRRFAADRQPLQYKPVPVTEYVLVYRKQTDKLIDWNIRRHHDQDLVERSRIHGKYDITNVWRITPGHHPKHPAVFPPELVQKIIRYYSFMGDMVLDPFAGVGTVGKVAVAIKRRFLLIDNDPRYFAIMKEEVIRAAGSERVDLEISDSFVLEEEDV